MAYEPLVMKQIKKKINIDIFIWWLLEENQKCQKRENPTDVTTYTLRSRVLIFFSYQWN